MIKTFEKSFKVEGRGNSLWCSLEESKREFEVTGYLFNNFCDTGEPYELQLFGPETEWFHYTDTGIQRDVNKHLKQWVQEQYPDYEIIKIVWSEQGMQPSGGWSFDIITK
jgi:hypothetical protein